MKFRWVWMVCMTGGMMWGAVPAGSQVAHADALLSSGGPADLLLDSETANSPDMTQYAEGKKAIHDGRWADAVAIFDRMAAAGGAHADSALYWKAYAENKVGRGDDAIKTCQSLVSQFKKSSWIEDCGALEIEIHASTGKPLEPKADQSDQLKLLALAGLLRSHPEEATQQIKDLVQSDASERLKEDAVFILGEQVPESTYAQIVRISYLEGDVRIARAAENEKSKTATWETAVMNLPLNDGDSIVTGKDGRVEIELEDASTIYLDANSVLNCMDMHTTAGVPHTELALVSGTLTTHIDSLMAGETFLLRTPTENMLTRYPEKSDMRITSYLDSMALTSMSGGGMLNVTGTNKVALTPGWTLYFSEGHPVTTAEEHGKIEDHAEFDAWVADRFAARTSATAAMMKDAGLQKPIPGLADMKGKGHFFACPPYGTCWEPDAPQAKAVLTAGPTPPPTPKTARPSAGGATNGTPIAMDWFPCLNSWYPGTMGYSMGYGGYTGYPTGYGQNPGAFYVGMDPYAWAVCHSGWWVPYGNRYAWVPGTARHHKCPVKWVKFGRTTVAVPLHPKDVKGKAPLNRDYGLQPVKGKDGMHMVPIRFAPGKPVEVVKSPPRAFRNAPQPMLPRTGAPRMETFALHENLKAGVPARTAIPMSFNHQQGFMTSHQVMQGGRPVAVNVPVGRVGGGAGAGVAGRSGGGFGGGFAGGRTGGSVGFGAVSAARSGGPGGGYSGASGHAGGGSFSGGGGGHVGGGTVSSTSTSVSAPAATSTAAPSGGSHK